MLTVFLLICLSVYAECFPVMSPSAPKKKITSNLRVRPVASPAEPVKKPTGKITRSVELPADDEELRSIVQEIARIIKSAGGEWLIKQVVSWSEQNVYDPHDMTFVLTLPLLPGTVTYEIEKPESEFSEPQIEVSRTFSIVTTLLKSLSSTAPIGEQLERLQIPAPGTSFAIMSLALWLTVLTDTLRKSAARREGEAYRSSDNLSFILAQYVNAMVCANTSFVVGISSRVFGRIVEADCCIR